MGDYWVTLLSWRDLEIFGAFGDVSAVGATAWRRGEGHELHGGRRMMSRKKRFGGEGWRLE